MADLPYMKFFPADYLRDTEILSLSAQGGWMRVLCSMWHPSRRGVLSLRLQAMARLLHASEPTTKSIVDEIGDCEVGVVEWSDGGERVTITCRRIVRDWEKLSGEQSELSDKRAEAARARWEKQRQSARNAGGKQDSCKSNASAEQVHSTSNAIPEARSQKPEDYDATTRACEVPSVAAVLSYAGSAPVAISPECAQAFHDSGEAEGWIGKSGRPIVNWQAALRRYASRWNEIEKSKPKPNGGDWRARKAERECPEPPRDFSMIPGCEDLK